MSKKIKSLLNKIASIFSDKTVQPPEASQAAKNTEKNVFGSDSPLPALKYAQMIELIMCHYRLCASLQGHINLNDMKKRLSKMNHFEVKMLFDALVEIKINHKDYLEEK